MDPDPDSFGVIIACTGRDWPLAAGTCASVRRYMPELPICLLVDGTLSPRCLGRFPGVRILNRNDVRDDALRRESFGWGFTKMVAFWESPFERFLYLDADTCVRGDLRPLLTSGADVIANGRAEVIHPPEIASRYWFDAEALGRITTGLTGEHGFFNAGVFLARRNLFDLSSYLELLDIRKRHAGIFCCGDQGILNLLVYRGVEAGSLSVERRLLQGMIPDMSLEEWASMYPGGGEAVEGTPPRVLYGCGPVKPWIRNQRKTFALPMTYDRMDFFQKAHGIRVPALGKFWLLSQEFRQGRG